MCELRDDLHPAKGMPRWLVICCDVMCCDVGTMPSLMRMAALESTVIVGIRMTYHPQNEHVHVRAANSYCGIL